MVTYINILNKNPEYPNLEPWILNPKTYGTKDPISSLIIATTAPKLNPKPNTLTPAMVFIP